MTDLHHSILIAASPSQIYPAVSTEAGMKGWWTSDTTMNASDGGTAVFGFNNRATVFRMMIDELVPDRCVRMQCYGDPPEWAETTLEWRIEPAEGDSTLQFVHRGWRQMSPFCASCNSMWGRLMFRLKDFVESGKPNPQWTR